MPVRKSSKRAPARKSARKPARKTTQKSTRKSARPPTRKSARKSLTIPRTRRANTRPSPIRERASRAHSGMSLTDLQFMAKSRGVPFGGLSRTKLVKKINNYVY